MCQFLSALVTKDGQVLHASEYTDSHEVLVRCFGYTQNDRNLHDDRRLFVRVEFTPPEDMGNITDLKQWRFKLDEAVAPAWFDAVFEEKAIKRLAAIVKKMLVGDERDILLGGCYILHSKARIKVICGGLIKLMLGSSQVGKMLGSSQVGEMWGSSQVGEMWGSSQVGKMLDSSQVGKMWGSSQVGEMWGSSQVGEMWDSSQVGKKTKNVII